MWGEYFFLFVGLIAFMSITKAVVFAIGFSIGFVRGAVEEANRRIEYTTPADLPANVIPFRKVPT